VSAADDATFSFRGGPAFRDVEPVIRVMPTMRKTISPRSSCRLAHGARPATRVGMRPVAVGQPAFDRLDSGIMLRRPGERMRL